MRILAPGKVNLALHLGRPRPDGYHEIVTLIEPLSLADELTMEPAEGGADEVHCPGIPGDNLALHALKAFREGFGWQGPAQRITIAKRVPVAAGMGGGSGDAAAVLRLATAASGMPLEDPVHAERLQHIAAGLGADVPSQLRPAPVLCTGTGTEIEPAPAPPEHGLLILPDPAGLSTPAVYREFDRLGGGRSPEELAAARDRLAAGDLEALFVNDLQDAARSLHPPIDDALAAARAAGADVAMVSGSGPTVFGLFLGADGPARAEEAAAALAAREPRPVAAVPVDAAFAAVR